MGWMEPFLKGIETPTSFFHKLVPGLWAGGTLWVTGDEELCRMFAEIGHHWAPAVAH